MPSINLLNASTTVFEPAAAGAAFAGAGFVGAGCFVGGLVVEEFVF